MNHGTNTHSIVPVSIIVAVLATFQLALAQTTEPILRVEAGAHNGVIYEIAMDPSNSILITGSEDKTVRIWDISGGGKLLRTLRPPVGEGEEGQIYAVGLSPDAKTVAIGGQTGSAQQNDACLYLFDRNTGALTRRLGGLPGYAQHLTYTPDGRFLAVVMYRGGMRVYRLPDYVLVAEDRDYGALAKWVVSDPTGTRLVTGCFDGFIRLYDLSALREQDTRRPGPFRLCLGSDRRGENVRMDSPSHPTGPAWRWHKTSAQKWMFWKSGGMSCSTSTRRIRGGSQAPLALI